jgi:hypothetical protein
MLVGFWRAVVSLLGGFPALRDAAGTKGERVGAELVVCTLASYGWSLPQLATDSLYICLRTCIFLLLFGCLAFWRFELHNTWIFTSSG